MTDTKRIIAFPRSGSHMIRGILSVLKGEMVVVEHDYYLEHRYTGVAYVNRNPIDVTYSRHVAEKAFNWDEKWIKELFAHVHAHRQWYLSNSEIIVDYNSLAAEIETGSPREWLKLSDFCGIKTDLEGWTNVFAENSKEKNIEKLGVLESPWFNDMMLSKEYVLKRKEFFEKFGSLWRGDEA